MIESDIEAWQRTGAIPFPELNLPAEYQFAHLEKVDLRLLHHICMLYRTTQRRNLLQFVVWIEKLPE